MGGFSLVIRWRACRRQNRPGGRKRKNPAGQGGVDAIHAHDVALANRFRAGLGLEPSNSAIVFCDVEDAADKLERAGTRAAVRGGRLRTSWHVYNTADHVDQTLDVLLG